MKSQTTSCNNTGGNLLLYLPPGVLSKIVEYLLEHGHIRLLRQASRATREAVDNVLEELKIWQDRIPMQQPLPPGFYSRFPALDTIIINVREELSCAPAHVGYVLGTVNCPQLRRLYIFMPGPPTGVELHPLVPMISSKFTALTHLCLPVSVSYSELCPVSRTEACNQTELVLRSLPVSLKWLGLNDKECQGIATLTFDEGLPLLCLEGIRHLTRLEHLVLTGFRWCDPPSLSGASWQSLQLPSRLTTLYISFGENEEICDTTLAWALAGLTSLKELELQEGIVQRTSLDCLATAIGNMTALERLDICDLEILLTQTEWANLASLPKLNFFRIYASAVHLSSPDPLPWTLWQAANQGNQLFPSMTELSVTAYPAADAFLLCALQDMRGLQNISLDNASGVSIEALRVTSNLTNLTHLEVYRPRCDDGVWQVGEEGQLLKQWSKQLTQLKCLKLALFNDLQNEHLVAAAKGLPQLQELNLYNCPQITSEALLTLAAMPNMKRLSMAKCGGVRAEGQAEDQEQLQQKLRDAGLAHVELVYRND